VRTMLAMRFIIGGSFLNALNASLRFFSIKTWFNLDKSKIEDCSSEVNLLIGIV
jgi:hypothetical protein